MVFAVSAAPPQKSEGDYGSSESGSSSESQESEEVIAPAAAAALSGIRFLYSHYQPF